MPLTRYRVRNKYSLADPELYRAADKDDPEALLEGVAMAGLVGVLRQLGDLAEFAAEIFHDLHEEVMATAARGHGLMVRVQQLEAEFPPIEKAFLCQTSHSSFFYNMGVYWHPNLRMDQNLIMKGDLPRFVMDSYEECRGPPRLSLLDKYDVVGAGACLKRYTDPSFFKAHSPTSGMMNAEVQKEKKTRKAKKKGSRWRNGETPKVLPTSHAKLHQLFLEENVENHVNNPARRVKLKRRLNGFPFDSKTGKSYMEKFLTPSLAHNGSEILGNSSPLKLPSNITDELGIKILEISTVSPEKESPQRKRSPCSSPDVAETGHKPSMDKLNEEINYRISEVPKLNPNIEADGVLSTFHEEVDEKEIMVDGESKREGSAYGYQSDDIASGVENYTDALNTMDSEMETETEYRAKNDLRLRFNIGSQGMYYNADEEQQDLQAHFSDSLSIGNTTATDDDNSSCRKGISSFSCSDSLTDLAENMPPHGDASAKVLPFTGVCEAQIVNASPYRYKEHTSTQPLQHMICNGVCNGETEIPSIGEPSSGSCVTDSGPALLPVDIGKSLMKGASVGPELDEISSEHNAGRIDPEENNICMGDNLTCTYNISDIPSQGRDDFLPVLAETNPAGDLDDEDLYVLSLASVHLSDNSELAPEKKSSENLLGNVHQAEYAEECVKNPIDSQIDSLQSVASPTEEQPLHSALPELETWYTDVNPDGCVSEVDGAPPLSRERAISSVPVVDSPEASKFTKQQHPEMTESVPPLESDSEEICFSLSREKNLDQAFKGVDDEESGGFSSDTDMIGEVVANDKIPSDFQNSSDTPILEVCVHLDDIVTETVQSEAVIVATAVSNTHYDDEGAAGKSISTSPKMLQEESVSILQDLPQNMSENNEACSKEHLQESGTEKVDQQVTLNSVMRNTACNDSKSDLLNNVPDTCMAAIPGNTLHNVGGTSIPLFLDQDDQASESKPPQLINIIEDREAVVLSPSHYIAELRTPLEQKVELQASHFDVGSQHAGKEDSDLFFQAAQTQSPNDLDLDVETNASSKFCAAHLPSQPLVSGFLPQLNASVQVVDPSSSALSSFGLLTGASQINVDEMPPLPPLPPMQWRIGKVQHAALPPEKGLVQHTLDPFPQILHSVTDKQAHFDHSAIEGKITPLQNPCLPQAAVKKENSQYGYGNNLAVCMVHSDPLSLQLPTMANHNHGNNEDDAAVKEDNSQYGYDNNLAGYMVHSDPLSLRVPTIANHNHVNNEDDAAVKEDNSQDGYDSNLAGYMVHSDPLSLQVPTMVNHNHGNNGDDFTTSGKIQSTNPLSPLPAMPNESTEHGFLSSEGGTAVAAQPALDTFSQVTNIEDKFSTCPPTSLQEKLVHPLHQLPSQKSSEDNTLHCTPVIPEREVVNPSDTTSLSLPGQDDQPLLQHDFPGSEGETAWSSSTSVPVASFEDGKPNGNHQRKLPRPRNPLIDAVIAHDKSKLRKVTERVQPQVGQKLDERDSLLEQIRAKSFNLKPALMARPSIRGPKTNLKVAAILEKANSIRQALAGSDEDDDADGWSDS